MSRRLLLLFTGLILSASMALSGCARSDAPACSFSSDCDDAQICSDGVCENISDVICNFNVPCPSGFSCVDESCVSLSGDGDGEAGGDGNGDQGDNDSDNDSDGDNTGNGPGDSTGDGDGNGDGNGDGPDFPVGSPQVESVTPLDGAFDIPLNTTVRVKFDRPIAYQFGRLTEMGVYIETPDGSKVGASLEYEVEEREVVITPNAPLWPGTTYTVNVTEFILDSTESFALAQQFRSTFSTEYEIDGDLQALAELYAPVLYQETRSLSASGIRSDIPTRVDFDGDFNGANNKSNGLSTNTQLPAHVYWSVISTESHYFIRYILYYVARRYGHGSNATYNEHDFTGLVVVVNRDTLEVDLVQGVHNYESTSQTQALTYRPSGSPVQGRGNNENSILNVQRSDLEEGASFPVYIPSGDHAGCFWHRRSDNVFFPASCPGNPGEFVGNQGVILRLGSQAQTYAEATDSEVPNILEMTYTLLPFVDPFWTQRQDSNCGLFSQTGFTYSPWSPAGVTPRVGPGSSPVYLPRALCSNDNANYGNLPYRWFSSISTGGEWFLDPAMALSDRYNFGDDFSFNYCQHFYFNIDRRDNPACGGGGE